MEIDIEKAIHTDPYAFADEMYSDRIYAIDVDQYDSPKFVIGKFIDSQKMVKLDNPQIENKIIEIEKRKLFKINEDIMNNLDLPEKARFTDVARPKHLLTSLFDIIIAKEETIEEVENLEKFFIPNFIPKSIYINNDLTTYFGWFNIINRSRSTRDGLYPSKYISSNDTFSDVFFISPPDNINYYIDNVFSKMEEYFKLTGIWPRVCINTRYNQHNKYLYYYCCFDYRTNTLAMFKVFSISDAAEKDIVHYIYNMQCDYPKIDLSYHITVYNKQCNDFIKKNFKKSLNEIVRIYNLGSIEKYENVFRYCDFDSIVSTILYKLSWTFEQYNQLLHPLIIVDMGFEFRLCIIFKDNPKYWSFSSSEDLYKFIDALNSSEDLNKFIESLNYKKGDE